MTALGFLNMLLILIAAALGILLLVGVLLDTVLMVLDVWCKRRDEESFR